MGAAKYVCYVLFVWMLISSFLQLYFAFQAPRCMPDQDSCYRPLFLPKERVGIYVYLTTDSTLEWWTAEGLGKLEQMPFLNHTVAFGDSSPLLQATVPFSMPALQAVRRNQSLLYAHSYLVRSGARLSEELGKASSRGKGPPSRGILTEHALHTSSTLVKPLPKVSKRRNLLDAKADQQHLKLKLPGIGWEVPVDPTAIFWVASSSVMLAFVEPTPLAAALRHCLLVATAMLAQAKVAKPEQQAAEKTFLFAPPEIEPHLASLLRLEVAADSEDYDDRYPAPLQYKELVFKGDLPVPSGERSVRYPVLLLSNKEKRYAPPFFVDTLSRDVGVKSWRPLDSNTSRLDPNISAEVVFSGMLKYTATRTMTEAIKPYMKLGFTEQHFDEVKEFLLRYPLHVLVIMQVVGFLQMSLWTLAFKNDVSFFKGRADYIGLSSRSMGTAALQEVVWFLYLFDVDVSKLLLFQLGVQACFSIWKYIRVARLGLRWTHLLLPWVRNGRAIAAAASTDHSDEDYTEEVDARAMSYTKMVLYPLSACWGLYNLYHSEYKSWWSWMISSMADFAYTFSFINMLPQIFINYKLRSVAHMPWRVLVYKFFNTFIDDIFAFFIIDTSTKYRFMTLRDDIVFFVFLYQRHIYSVDHRRADEYGFVHGEQARDDQALELPKGEAEKDKPGECAAAHKDSPERNKVQEKDGPSDSEQARDLPEEGASEHAEAPKDSPEGDEAQEDEPRDSEENFPDAFAEGHQCSPDTQEHRQRRIARPTASEED
ncbi:unnamed protein product [Effrenium voratum]|uniref:Cleft lip and palate associated transmembrane protein n=1 Tax=Effrenium voratum TaxID=2562239 RepID=A0AA36HWI4_9DINO|nr:unnamed protein product [Effrenium voratum]